ncbi:MAG: TauD/TfdA family dioxygenase [Nitrospinae bacterium]|nr:TauD/TfdA family dioxygenase [Nitrospinota bacterium]
MNFLSKVEYKGEDNIGEKVVEALYSNKIVHFTGFDFHCDILEFYTKLSDNFPTILNAGENIEDGNATGSRWISIQYDPNYPMKYRTSKTRHPLHTDNSYVPIANNITFFFCKAFPPYGGATIFLDSATLIELLEMDNKQALLDGLKTIPVCFSKTDRNKTMPIITEDTKGLILNYNYACLDKSNTKEAVDLVEEFQDFLDNRVVMGGIATPMPLAPGEAVFFHDERLLHGRNAFFTPTPAGRDFLKGVALFDQ